MASNRPIFFALTSEIDDFVEIWPCTPHPVLALSDLIAEFLEEESEFWVAVRVRSGEFDRLAVATLQLCQGLFPE